MREGEAGGVEEKRGGADGNAGRRGHVSILIAQLARSPARSLTRSCSRRRVQRVRLSLNLSTRSIARARGDIDVVLSLP
jgi:hypothetical protein